MKATDITGTAPGGKRVRLVDVLPLDTPFMIEVYPMYACNFACKYCMMSLKKEQRRAVSRRVSLDYSLYRRCIDDIATFPEKLKILRFAGIGEPLLHKQMVDMVAYAASKNVAEKIEIISNGSLLTPQRSDALIAAGLTRLIVSIQGTTAEKYWEISGVRIDLDEFIDNLRYFYRNKTDDTQIYIKIADEALADQDDEDRFYQLFGDICDTIGVEHIVPIQPGIDYGKVLKDKNKSVTQFGLAASEVTICPQPFFTLRINTDGRVLPCYSYEFPCFVGDCNCSSVYEVWNGPEYRAFRRKMLDGVTKVSPVCARCKIIKHRLFPEDMITPADAERLKRYY